MKVTIQEINREQEEEIILRCHELNADMLHLLNNIKTLQSGLIGFKGEEIHRLALNDIYYVEVVDNKSFFYCNEEVFESRMKLYEFEEMSQGTSFFRASKSMILNSDKIEYIAPSLSGRFEVTLLNRERVVVSRQYVNNLKQLMGL